MEMRYRVLVGASWCTLIRAFPFAFVTVIGFLPSETASFPVGAPVSAAWTTVEFFKALVAFWSARDWIEKAVKRRWIVAPTTECGTNPRNTTVFIFILSLMHDPISPAQQKIPLNSNPNPANGNFNLCSVGHQKSWGRHSSNITKFCVSYHIKSINSVVRYLDWGCSILCRVTFGITSPPCWEIVCIVSGEQQNAHQ